MAKLVANGNGKTNGVEKKTVGNGNGKSNGKAKSS